ncbi:MAG: glycosyltransferase family 2 protein [Thermoplasmata archaeon]|nr:glycosyltransferase family 2 protein [Thermoplasmata archaeon]
MPGPTVSSGGGSAVDPATAFEGIELAIVLPTLNEEEGLRATYPELPIATLERLGWKVRALIIDGGSTDGTLAVAAKYGLPVLRQRTRGKGAAIQEALAWLLARGVRYAVVLDADCTYPGESIGPMAALLDQGSEVVVGVRYPAILQGGARESIHRWGNAFLNLTASVLSDRPIMDLCSGLWGVRLDVAQELKLESTRFEVESELFIKASRSGLLFNQIPITYRDRVGEAKLRAVRDGVQIFLTLFRWAPRVSRTLRPPPKGNPFIRSLLAVCFVQGTDQLEIHSAHDRLAEAESIAKGLRQGGLSVSVSPTPESMARNPFAGVPDPGPSTPGVIVTLPARSADGSETPLALAHIPHRGRIVVVGAPEGRVPEWLKLLPERGYRLDGGAVLPGILSPLQAAHASVTGRRPRQETALLRANAYRTNVRIYQRPGGIQVPSWPSPHPRERSSTRAIREAPP